MILTFNPGGQGHSWLKESGTSHRHRLGWFRSSGGYLTGRHTRISSFRLGLATTRSFCRTTLTTLTGCMVGSPELVRAWLEGDFDINIGAYFPELGQRHRVQAFPILKHWRRIVGFDWGYNSPFLRSGVQFRAEGRFRARGPNTEGRVSRLQRVYWHKTSNDGSPAAFAREMTARLMSTSRTRRFSQIRVERQSARSSFKRESHLNQQITNGLAVGHRFGGVSPLILQCSTSRRRVQNYGTLSQLPAG